MLTQGFRYAVLLLEVITDMSEDDPQGKAVLRSAAQEEPLRGVGV
jgi:hypothetical protein